MFCILHDSPEELRSARSLSVEHSRLLYETTHLVLHYDVVRLVVVITIHKYVGMGVAASPHVDGVLAELLCVCSTLSLEAFPKERFLWLFWRLDSGAEEELCRGLGGGRTVGCGCR